MKYGFEGNSFLPMMVNDCFLRNMNGNQGINKYSPVVRVDETTNPNVMRKDIIVPGAGGWGQASMPVLSLAVTLYCVQSLTNAADAKGRGLHILLEGQEAMRNQRVKDYQEQIKTAIEKLQQERNGSFWNTLFDWIISVAEVISGVVKCVVCDFAGGAADLAAGVTGIGKSLVETIAPDAGAVSILGYVQNGFETIGMVVDVVGIWKTIRATRGIADTAKSVASKAFRSGRLGIAYAEGAEVLTQKSMEFAEIVAKEAFSVAERELMQAGLARQLEGFSEEWIKDLVAKTTKRVTSTIGRAGGDFSTELSKEIGKQVQGAVAKRAISVNTGFIYALRAGASGAQQTVESVLELKRGALRRDIQELMLQQRWLDWCFNAFERARTDATKQLGDWFDKQKGMQESASRMIEQSGMVLTELAQRV